MTASDAPRRLLTTRQAAHVLGIKPAQLIEMFNRGETCPTYQMGTGGTPFLWELTEIKRLNALRDRKMFRRRRHAATPDAFNAFAPVKPRVRVRRKFPTP